MTTPATKPGFPHPDERPRARRGPLAGLAVPALGLAVVIAALASPGMLVPGQAGGVPPGDELIVKNPTAVDFSKHAVTFIELGADRCIPCREMQPIMRQIALAYKDKVQVVFYDVWKDPEPGRTYKIQLIPTQVFVDSEGREFHRHVGLYPKAEIVKLLKSRGLE